MLEENRPEPKDAIRADTAYVMTNLLRGVVQRGTAGKAAALNWPIGGKTGTTDDYTDAWFIGFDPDITIGVWTGFDQKRTMGPPGTGAESALPIWMDIMKAWIGKRTEPPTFDAPGNIVFMSVERGTGNPAIEGDAGAITEVVHLRHAARIGIPAVKFSSTASSSGGIGVVALLSAAPCCAGTAVSDHRSRRRSRGKTAAPA